MNSSNTPDLQKLSSEEKRKLVEQLLARKANKSKGNKAYSLSYLQQGLWSLSQFVPESWGSNVLFSAKILSKVDVMAWQKACKSVIERHPTLKTNYTIENEVPVQKINSQSNFNLEHIDATDWSATQLSETITTIIRQPFDLEKDSVIRVSLLTQSPEEHILLLVVHHIAVDLWSLMIIMDELRLLYANQLTDSPTPLPSIKSTYLDYVEWQAQMLKTARGKKLKEYWHTKLSGELPVLDLLTDKPRPTVQTFAGASHTFRIKESLTRQLRELAKSQNVSLYTVLLAAFSILLCRHSDREEVMIGTPVACRSSREFKSVVGGFINLVALRGDITGNPTFANLLNRVQNVVLEALQHQEYPFQLLVQELSLARDSSRSPVFQAMFLLQKLQRGEDFAEFIVPTPSETVIYFGGLAMQPYPIPHQEGNHDLTLEAIEANGSLQCIFKYNPLLFESSTILAIIGRFQTLLQNIVLAPQQPISSLSLLDRTESDRILGDWSSSKTEYSPKAQCIHQLFAEQAAKNPEAIAVTFEEARLTYQELNERANQLAHHLQKLGVKPETLVGICVERSLEMIIGLLGILKAGGAYVPIDPKSPPERLKFILEDADIDILLTQKLLSTQFPTSIPHLLCLDDKSLFESEPKTNPHSEVELDNLIYIIYTSGSTGKPKGVEITHHNVTSLFAATESSYQFSSADKWTLFHSFAFDFAVWEIWGALAYGGTLVVVPYLVSRSPEQFHRLLSEQKITVLNQTPSAFTQLISNLDRQIGQYPLNLRLIVFGGEKLSFPSLKPWYASQTNSDCRLVNMYGITEITVHATHQEVSEVLIDSEQSLIGHPLADLEIYILDRYLNPVPTGVPGELYIAGEGVARGYLNRPQLTTERFLDNPFGAGKLYKTGDLARYVPTQNDASGDNSKIEFLGRIDNQVKLRGFRIELGEIERVLEQNSAVNNAVVIVREETPGDRRLVAYIVWKSEQSSSINELKQFLKSQLPDYMIPALFVTLEQLPLTINGKVNLRALPIPSQIRQEGTESLIAPRTQLETELTTIWERVLNIQPIGIEDNFFDLGGHSLLALQLFNQIKNKLNRELPVTTLFQAPTIEQLAPLLEQPKVTQSSSNLVEIQGGDFKAPWFFIHAAGGGGMIQFRELSSYIGSDRPFYGLDSLGLHGEINCPDTIEETATLYLQEIRKIQPQGTYFLGGLCFGGLVAYEIAQQLHDRGEEVGLLVMFNAYVSGALKRIPKIKRFSDHAIKTIQEGPNYGMKKLQGKIQWLKNRQQEQLREKNFAREMQSSESKAKPTASKSRRQILYDIHYQAGMNYNPKPYPGKVTLFQTEGDLTPPEGYYKDPQWGWGELATGGLEIHVVPGRHNNILVEPHIKVHGKKLRACIDRAHQNFGIS